jgi:SAM-dependent methyltransferase
MTFSLVDLQFLSSERGSSLLNDLSHLDLTPQNTLPLITSLRKHYRAEEVASALTMVRLRAKGADKFGADAGRMFFTEDALEQASDPMIRAYRSRWGDQGNVLDVCCGIGSDSLAFAAQGSDVLGLDLDELRITIAQHNAVVLGLDARFMVQDVTQGIPTGFRSIFFDPARRDAQGKRIYHVDAYLPPLKLVHLWQAERIMVKLSPGVQLDEIQDYGGLLEFISVDGDLKEAVLHLGEGLQGLRATLLRSQGTLHWDAGEPEPDVSIAEPGGWLCEPDPALLRAGLVRMIAGSHAGTAG